MCYEGIETTGLTDEDLKCVAISDLEVFICPHCENKVWLHKIENSEPYRAKTIT